MLVPDHSSEGLALNDGRVVPAFIEQALRGGKLTVFGDGWSRAVGAGAWALMAVSFQPMLRYYKVSPLWGIVMPAIGALYTLFTIQSAVQVWRGKGGMWKGRSQALAAQP